MTWVCGGTPPGALFVPKFMSHYACDEQLKKLGGKTPCCECTRHECAPHTFAVTKVEGGTADADVQRDDLSEAPATPGVGQTSLEEFIPSVRGDE